MCSTEGPLDWPDATVASADAIDVVARMTRSSSHGTAHSRRLVPLRAWAWPLQRDIWHRKGNASRVMSTTADVFRSLMSRSANGSDLPDPSVALRSSRVAHPYQLGAASNFGWDVSRTTSLPSEAIR
jgi:hypothetical protein